MIYEAAGKVPERGDAVEVPPLAVTVEEVEDQRIRRVLIRARQALPGFARREIDDPSAAR